MGKLWSTSREGVEADSTRSSLVDTFITMTCQGIQALLIDVAAARRESERAVYLGLLWTRWLRRPFLLGPLLRSKDSEGRGGAVALGALGGVWAPALWLKGARPTRAGLVVGLIGAAASIARDRSWKGVLAGLNASATAALGNDPRLSVEGGPGWGISHGANLGLVATVIDSAVRGRSSGDRLREAGTQKRCGPQKFLGSLRISNILARFMAGVGELLISDGLTRRH